MLPKILRDVNVLPIWEDSGNIIVLDMLRAAQKSEGLSLVFNMIEEAADQSDNYGTLINERLSEIKSVWESITKIDDQDQIEATAKPLFKQLITLVQMALLIEENESVNSDRFDIALKYFAESFNTSIRTRKPLDTQKIEELMGWAY